MNLNTAKGDLHIASDVFTSITGAAATNCYGVKGMAVRSKTDGLVHLLRRESMPRASKLLTTKMALCPSSCTSLWTTGSI